MKGLCSLSDAVDLRDLNDQDKETIRSMSKYARETLSLADVIVLPYLCAEYKEGIKPNHPWGMLVNKGEFVKLVSDLCNRMRNFKSEMGLFHERVTNLEATYVLELRFSECCDNVLFLYQVRENRRLGKENLLFRTVQHFGETRGLISP